MKNEQKIFLKNTGIIAISSRSNDLNELSKMTEPISSTENMPVLFLGHGSPMNAIEENKFVTGF